ncbi:hypothetical protein KAZ66_04965 [Candidatus Woesebacteria bacterium]|nr:hypothetical protein [Candidatus Woesebacteria bacterium]
MSTLLTKHALARIRDRKFNKAIVVEIVDNPDYLFYDTKTKSFVAISSSEYGSQLRQISVFYHEDTRRNKIIRTFHPEDPKEIQNRIVKGRYIKVK